MIVRAGPKLTKEELEKKIAQITSNFPHAKIIPIGDGVKIVGISQQEEEIISGIIEKEGVCMNESVQQQEPIQPAKVLLQDSVSTGEKEFALVAKNFFAHTAQEKISLIEKAIQEKIDEISGKVEERDMFWTNSWNNFVSQLKTIEQQFDEFMVLLNSIKQKIALMETAWDDERSKRNGEVASNLADHKKVAEAVAKTIQYLRDIPIPK